MSSKSLKIGKEIEIIIILDDKDIFDAMAFSPESLQICMANSVR
jgi:hypothetical protein